VAYPLPDGYMLFIVMGTHGRTGIGRFLLGSVAARVVQTAECPVLTVKREALRGETEPHEPARSSALGVRRRRHGAA
jgi:hypothetical protein